MKHLTVLLPGLLSLAACSGGSQHEDRSPNVIFIIADDLGYGDLSCYGQERFGTPNIDSLAADGVMFTRHYAGTSVSAPSRSSLITGLYTGHTPIRGNKELPVEGQHPIPGDTYNIYRLMKSQGYVTGVFGKWGLGAPSTEGVLRKLRAWTSSTATTARDLPITTTPTIYGTTPRRSYSKAMRARTRTTTTPTSYMSRLLTSSASTATAPSS